MDDSNVKFKFEVLLRSSESFKHLNTLVLSIGTCAIYITHNEFGHGIKVFNVFNQDFNVDSFAIDINFFPSSRLHAEQTTLTLGS